MKIQCPACKEIVPLGAFTSSAEGIELTCEACEVTTFVASSGAARAVARPPVADREPGEGEMRCPKCEEVQPEGESCRACGLRAELFDEFVTDQRSGASAALGPLWDQVEANWDDDDAHEQFANKAADLSEYTFAARRYRAVLRERPDDARAQDRLERVRKMAEATMMSVAAVQRDTPRDKTPYRNVFVLLLALVALALVGGIYLVLTANSAADDKGAQKERAGDRAPAGPPAPRRTRRNGTRPAPAPNKPAPARATPSPKSPTPPPAPAPATP